MKKLFTALVFCGMASLYAQAPIPKALAEAKTVYIVNGGASQGLVDDVAKELTKWGRFELVDSEAASDITITLRGLKAFKGWPMTVTNSRDGSPLWSAAQKRGISNKVSTDLVKKLRKLLEDKKK
jgi:hypothetical protein